MRQLRAGGSQCLGRMADEQSLFSSTIRAGLGDKSAERRKQAAADIVTTVRTSLRLGLQPSDELSRLIRCLVEEYCCSAFPNKRKGGLLGLSSVTIALEHDPVQSHMDQLVPPVLICFSDEDPGVRYSACEAFYNIAKVARHGILPHFDAVFDGLCKLYADVEQMVKDGAQCLDRLVRDIVTESRDFNYAGFVPLLTTRIRVLNPFVRQLVLGWIVLLDSVPEVDMIAYLPQYLEGLFGILASDNRDVRHGAELCLTELLAEIKGSPALRAQRVIADAAPTVARCCRAGERRPEDNYVRLTALHWLLEFVRLQEGSEVVAMSDELESQPPVEPSVSLGPRWVTGGLQLAPSAAPGSSTPQLLPRRSTSSLKASHRQQDVGAAVAAVVVPPPLQLPAVQGREGAVDAVRSQYGYRHQRNPSTNSSGSASPPVPGMHLALQSTPSRSANFAQQGTATTASGGSPTLGPQPSPTGVAGMGGSFGGSGGGGGCGLQKLTPVLLEGALHCLDDAEMEIRQNAEQANKALLEAAQRQGSDPAVEAVMEAVLGAVRHGVAGGQERSDAVLLACFRWARLLLERCPLRVLQPALCDRLFEFCLTALRRAEDEVVVTALGLVAQLVAARDAVPSKQPSEAGLAEGEALGEAAEGAPVLEEGAADGGDIFAAMCHRLLRLMAEDPDMLASRGELVVRELCTGVGAERFFATAALATATAGEKDVLFARRLVRVLNQVLLTSHETGALRRQLFLAAAASPRPGAGAPAAASPGGLQAEHGLSGEHGTVPRLLLDLLVSWFHCPVSTLTLCLWLHWFELAAEITSRLAQLRLTPDMRQQLSDFIDLLESPVFMRVRLQLLETRGQPGLLHVVLGLVALLPREQTLRSRLRIVETGLLLERCGFKSESSLTREPGLERPGASGGGHQVMDVLLERFDAVAHRHGFYGDLPGNLPERREE